MSKEVKIKYEKASSDKYELLRFIDLDNEELRHTSSSLSDYEYFAVIEESAFSGKVILRCWDEGDRIEDVCVYIAREN